jgi:hypothetical protein
MARRKTLPDSVQAKFALAERLRLLRSELYGERGGPELARRLGLPIRTWYNYESGVTVPAEVVLKIIELTSVEPIWLLHGEGPKFRSTGSVRPESLAGPDVSVGALLRTALQMLESNETTRWASHLPRHEDGNAVNGESVNGSTHDVALIEVDDIDLERLAQTSGPQYVAARSEWLDAERDCRCIQVIDDAMAPILMDGAYVAFAKSEEPLTELDGKMVVTWIEGQPIVRWFQFCDKIALLRAQNPDTVPNQLLLDLETDEFKFRRVLWINTPH